MAKISPKTCTAVPASTNAAMAPAEFNRKSAVMTITHPAASRRNPAILMFLHAFFGLSTDYATLAKFIGPIEIFDRR
jgi:hypothetical protein